MEQTEEILIVGAGVAGLATALALHRLGLRSTVLESSSNLRISGYGILTWTNAWRALDALGVGNHLRERHLLLQEMQAVSSISGLVTSSASFMEKGKSGNHEVRCLIRKVLLETLAKDLPRGTIKYSSKVVHIEDAGCLKLVHLANGPIIKAKVLIGCDGVNSVVAKWLKLQRPIHTQRAAVRGIVQFPNGHGLEPKVLQHYGSGIRHGYAPCDEKSVYWFMTYVTSEKRDKEMENNQAMIKEFVLNGLGNVSPKSKTLVEKTELEDISVGSLKLRSPWDMLLKNISKDNVCVAGDAFHPMTPDIGQGGCSALEDAIVLARCLREALTERVGEETSKDKEDVHRRIKDGLEKYARERRWRSFMLITTAYLVGKIQQSNRSLIRFLREKFLSGMLLQALLKSADFDCGYLSHV